MLNRFFLALFNPGLLLYIYTNRLVKLRWIPATLDKHFFFAIFDAGIFTGDFVSRRIFFARPYLFPLKFLAFSIVGSAISLCPVPELVLLGGFFVAFTNGSVYAQATRRIETKGLPRFSLMSFSVWLFIGDLGSVVGSNMTQVIAEVVKRWYK